MTHFGTGTMPDCWDALPNLRCPTLLMVGEEDEKYRGLSNQMMERLSEEHTEYAVISGGGHCAHFGKYVREFTCVETVVEKTFQLTLRIYSIANGR